MNESIYHVYANYCGERKLLFAGYASRVARKLHCPKHELRSGEYPFYSFGPTRDKFGNAMPYTLWSGPVTIAEFIPTTEVVEYEGEAA